MHPKTFAYSVITAALLTFAIFSIVLAETEQEEYNRRASQIAEKFNFHSSVLEIKFERLNSDMTVSDLNDWTDAFYFYVVNFIQPDVDKFFSVPISNKLSAYLVDKPGTTLAEVHESAQEKCSNLAEKWNGFLTNLTVESLEKAKDEHQGCYFSLIALSATTDKNNQLFRLPATNPTATAAPTFTRTPVTASVAVSGTTGTVNRDANLRAGPGTGNKIVGSAKNGQIVTIIGKNADGSWLQLDNKAWIAAFLVNQGQSDAQPEATSVSTLVATSTPTVAPAPKVQYWGDTGVQTCGGFEWRVSNVRRSKDAWYYDRKQVAQGEYLIVYVEVKNISSGTASFWETKPSMPGKEIAEQASQYAAWMMTGGFNTLWKDDVAPGEFITLVGAFDVAPDTHTYLFGALSCEQIVAIGSWFELDRGPIKASN